MREETQKTIICVFCKLPITTEQRPSVSLEAGREVHTECWDEYEEMERRLK